jgi:sigma-B regulation protein RsbU (phosphoserine phosphatase)
MARIKPGRNASPQSIFPLGFCSSVGTDRSNAIVLSGKDILAHHADFETRGGKVFVVCAGKGAVCVNGVRVKAEQELRDGDLVMLGSQEWVFEAAAPLSPVKAATQRLQALKAAGPELDPKTKIRAFGDVLEVLDSFKKSERLQVHIATLYRVANVVSATLSPGTLREKLFDILFEVMAPDRVFLVVNDESGRQKIFSQRIRENVAERGLAQIGQTIVKHVNANREAVLLESFETETRFRKKDDIGELIKGSCVCAPMIRQGKVRGVLYADRVAIEEDYRQFHDDDLKLLNAIAVQFSIAYENALMYEQTVEFSKKLTALNESARALSGSLEVETVVRAAADAASRILECDKCSILLWDEAAQVLKMSYSNWLDPQEWPQVQIKPGEGYAGAVFQDGAPLLVVDSRQAMGGTRRSYRSDSFLIVPISMSDAGEREARPIGVISVTDRKENRAFEESDQKVLGILALQLGTSIRSASLLLEQKLLSHELGIAAKIQSGLLPKGKPHLEGFDIAAHYQPKGAVGGDYYDFVRIDDDRLGLVVADVSGKGVPASMIMTEMRTALHIMSFAAPSPKELMGYINRRIHADIPRNMFITAVYGILDRRDRSFTFVNCGHNPTVLWRHSSGRAESLSVAGMALGPDAGPRFDSAAQEFRIELAPGDRVVLYSDGLTEAMNPKDEMYEERFLEIMGLTQGRSSREYIEEILDDLARFRDGREQPDDLTIVTARLEEAVA